MMGPICFCCHEEDEHLPEAPSICQVEGCYCQMYDPDEEQEYESRGMT